ncbi:hypothetical protein [Bradyrhizobium sp. USDA 4469]
MNEHLAPSRSESNSLPQNGFSPRQFAKRNGIGITKTYEEINAGRLIARKCGSRTIITIDEERAWLQGLPKISSKRRSNPEAALPKRELSFEEEVAEHERKRLHQDAKKLRARLNRARRRVFS